MYNRGWMDREVNREAVKYSQILMDSCECVLFIIHMHTSHIHMFSMFFRLLQNLEAKPFRLGVLRRAQVHLLCRVLLGRNWTHWLRNSRALWCTSLIFGRACMGWRQSWPVLSPTFWSVEEWECPDAMVKSQDYLEVTFNIESKKLNSESGLASRELWGWKDVKGCEMLANVRGCHCSGLEW